MDNINTAFIKLKPITELEEVNSLEPGWLMFDDGTGALKKMSTDNFYQLLHKIATPIKPDTSGPFIANTWYKPNTYSSEPGTNYPNAGNLKAVEGYDTLFFYNGSAWVDVKNKMPQSKIDSWTASSYPTGKQVFYQGKIYEANSATTSTDTPGSSSKWVEKTYPFTNDDELAPIITSGQYWTVSGTSANFGSLERTERLPIDPTIRTFVDAQCDNSEGCNVFFDSNNAFISYFNIKTAGYKEILIPSNARSIGITANNGYAIKIKKLGNKNAISSLVNQSDSITSLVNSGLVDIPVIFNEIGRKYIETNGTIQTNGNYKISGFIAGVAGDKVKVTVKNTTGAGTYAVGFFNSSNIFVSGIKDNVDYIDQELTFPAGSSYIVLNSRIENTMSIKRSGYLISKINSTDYETKNSVKTSLAKVDWSKVGEKNAELKSKTGFGLMFGGQSNAVGEVPASYLASSGMPSSLAIDWFNGTTIQNPLNITTWGAWLPLMKKMLDNGRTPFYWNSAIAATAMQDTWQVKNKSSQAWIRAAQGNTLKGLKPNLDFKVMIWIQGEADSVPQFSPYYYENLKNYIGFVRGVLGNPVMKWIIVAQHPLQVQYSQVVRDAQMKIASEDSNIVFVNPDSLTFNPSFDTNHYDPPYTVALGNMLYEIIKDY